MTELARVTIRGEDTEIRGFLPTASLPAFAAAMEPFGIVMASPLGGPSELSNPSLATSIAHVESLRDTAFDEAAFIAEVATLHYLQAMVIRGERDRAEAAERELTNQ